MVMQGLSSFCSAILNVAFVLWLIASWSQYGCSTSSITSVFQQEAGAGQKTKESEKGRQT